MKTRAAVTGITTITTPQTKLHKKFTKDGVMDFLASINNCLLLIILTVCYALEKRGEAGFWSKFLRMEG
jgi:hypothetical protein